MIYVMIFSHKTYDMDANKNLFEDPYEHSHPLIYVSM